MSEAGWMVVRTELGIRPVWSDLVLPTDDVLCNGMRVDSLNAAATAASLLASLE